jgi:hypothetical protein
MKQKFVLIMVLIIQAMFLFSAEPIKIIEQEARKEVLNNRQYRFYEYNHYSTGGYHVSMDLELDKSTSIRLYAFIDRVAQPSLVLEFSYDYEQVSNNLYFDSILTIISEEEQFQVIDKFPQIYGNLYNDGFFTFNFWLYHLGDDILKEIADSKSLELKIDETYLKLSEGQIRSIQQFIKNTFLAKLTDADVEYLGTQLIDIEYIDMEKLMSDYKTDNYSTPEEEIAPAPPAPVMPAP